MLYEVITRMADQAFDTTQALRQGEQFQPAAELERVLEPPSSPREVRLDGDVTLTAQDVRQSYNFV